MISARKLLSGYIVCDYLAANASWFLFTIARYWLTKDTAQMQTVDSVAAYLSFRDILAGQICFPLLIVFICYLSGYYNKATAFSKSRLQEFATTLFSTFVAAVLIYFIILINDNFQERYRNYELIMVMWLTIFIGIYIPRFFITKYITDKIKRGEIRFNTLIIGYNPSALSIAEALRNPKQPTGYYPVGVIPFDGESASEDSPLPIFCMDELDVICKDLDIRAIIIVPKNKSNRETLHLVNRLFHINVPIKIAPEMYDIITSNIKHSNIIGEPFVNIAQSNMPEWQKATKRTLDVMISSLALICLSPLFLLLSILIKRDSAGSVFYKQERIGHSGKPFFIYKFRTMVCGAEESGIPQLTSENDARITKIGSILRKYRIDETPQFWNVIKGDMSIV